MADNKLSDDWKNESEVELSSIARSRRLDFTLPSEYALGWRQCIDYTEKKIITPLQRELKIKENIITEQQEAIKIAF